MTAEHEALVLSLCTRGSMPLHARARAIRSPGRFEGLPFASGTKRRMHCEEICANATRIGETLRRLTTVV